MVILKYPTQLKPQIWYFFFQLFNEILSKQQKNLIRKYSRHWWRYYLKRYFMANVILLWSDSLLCIKLSTLKSFVKNCLKGFWEIFYDNYYYSIFFFPSFSGRWAHCFLPSSDHVNAKIKLTIMKSLEQ